MADFSHLRDRSERTLTSVLQTQPAPQRLRDAMNYSVLGGGKRIRAILVYLTTDALDADIALADLPAAAVELVHAYSLIHDDLPAMDDDDLRRGKPSCHIAFDEATAILAGDALQALAFQVIATDANLPARTRLEMVIGLAEAVGANGMVAGQMIDMSFDDRTFRKTDNGPRTDSFHGERMLDNHALDRVFPDRDGLENMHQLKTGALISLSARLGGMIARADSTTMAALTAYGTRLGLAFQIQDDILDATGEEHLLGKPPGSDEQTGKSTFVTVLGLTEARRTLEELVIAARDAISPLGPRAEPLALLAQYVGSRNH
ncbi:MAG: polyprenyl synthetase family protein [Proteobacteria bacterium]|jgi:farnesyl diphosphate synthase|nr:polyprenyl synthetase family protein [Pseudomonadota bacterium]MDA1299441.1 polyprenyl synthetase family protein [Pseudomonadota bacterium]